MTSGWIVTHEERSDAAIDDVANSLDCRGRSWVTKMGQLKAITR